MSVKYVCTSRVNKIYLWPFRRERRLNIGRDFYGHFHHFFRAALLSSGLLYFW